MPIFLIVPIELYKEASFSFSFFIDTIVSEEALGSKLSKATQHSLAMKKERRCKKQLFSFFKFIFVVFPFA